jgi:hypothetical protein
MVDDVAGIKWINPAPMDQQIITVRDNLITQMRETAGISQSTAGDASASQSGRAISYQAELDSNKHSDSFRSFETCQKDAWELTLKLVQKYYTDTRQIPVRGQETISFMGTDIAGATVRLEPRSQTESQTSSKLERTKTEIAQGLQPPSALASITPSPATAGMETIVREEIEKYLQDQPIQLGPETAPPELVVQIIEDRLNKAILQRDTDSVEALRALKTNYIKMLAQAGAGDAGGGVEPSPTGPAEAQGVAPLPDALPPQGNT